MASVVDWDAIYGRELNGAERTRLAQLTRFDANSQSYVSLAPVPGGLPMERDGKKFWTIPPAQVSAEPAPAPAVTAEPAAPAAVGTVDDALAADLPTVEGEEELPEPDVDWADLWDSYSQWESGALDTYTQGLESLAIMPGLSETTRQTELAALTSAYQGSIDELKGGATYSMLSEEFQRSGDTGEMSEYFTALYGGPDSPDLSVEIDSSLDESPVSALDSALERAARGPAPGQVIGSDADIAGLGNVGSWWR